MKRKFIVLAIIALQLAAACSRTHNPMVFSKIESKVELPPAPPVYTLLDLYLMEQVSVDYMMNWFFKDYKEYRYRLLYIKSLIESMQPISEHNRDRILLLQFTMNEAIDKFNERNVFSRATAVIRAGIQSRDKNHKYPQETLNQIKEKGASARHISDNPTGFLGSFMRYGFKIEKVNLLGNESADTESSNH